MNWTCPNCSELHEEQFDSCWKCGTTQSGSKVEFPDPVSEFSAVDSAHAILPCSTTPYLPGRTIDSVVGVVFGDAIMGANIIRDFAASLTEIVGGRSGAYEGNLRQGRAIALQELMNEAIQLGADGVIGFDIDYETITGSMLLVSASGTAVKLIPELPYFRQQPTNKDGPPQADQS